MSQSNIAIYFILRIRWCHVVDIQLLDTGIRQYFWALRERIYLTFLLNAILIVLLLLLFENKIVNKR